MVPSSKPLPPPPMVRTSDGIEFGLFAHRHGLEQRIWTCSYVHPNIQVQIWFTTEHVHQTTVQECEWFWLYYIWQTLTYPHMTLRRLFVWKQVECMFAELGNKLVHWISCCFHCCWCYFSLSGINFDFRRIVGQHAFYLTDMRYKPGPKHLKKKTMIAKKRNRKTRFTNSTQGRISGSWIGTFSSWGSTDFPEIELPETSSGLTAHRG